MKLFINTLSLNVLGSQISPIYYSVFSFILDGNSSQLSVVNGFPNHSGSWGSHLYVMMALDECIVN